MVVFSYDHFNWYMITFAKHHWRYSVTYLTNLLFLLYIRAKQKNRQYIYVVFFAFHTYTCIYMHVCIYLHVSICVHMCTYGGKVCWELGASWNLLFSTKLGSSASQNERLCMRPFQISCCVFLCEANIFTSI